MGKYGTNLEGFGAFEGGVNADKGAPLVSTSSDGETAFIFGAAALRTIQAGVENGDFAIPPDEASAAITSENPLPYWTLSNTTSTVTVETSASAASGNVLQFVQLGAGSNAILSRYVAIPGALDRSFSFFLEVYLNSYTAGVVTARYAWAKSDFTATGTGGSYSAAGLGAQSLTAGGVAPSDAAYMYISFESGTAAHAFSISEIRVNMGKQALYITDSDPTITPAKITSTSGTLSIVPATKTAVTGSLTTTGNIGVDGVIYFDSTLTGPYIQQAGTNGRIISVASATSTDGVDLLASTASARSGILITKATTGQPSTTLNGTGATDCFADVLRNGGLAVDSTNNRGYFYSGGWKFAALTTPSDSRLKDEITEITGALDTLRQLVPVAFKWKAPEAHGRTDCVADDGKRLGFIADQVATTDLAHWVETLGVDEREAHLVDTTEVLAVNIPQNEMEALVVQALLDIDTRLKALESR